jgi:uncharacterized protein (TIGR03435 family)
VERLLIECLIRSSLIAAAAGMLLTLFRIREAAVRHAVWTAVVVVMLLLPLWSSVGPKLALPLLPAEPAILGTVATPSVTQSQRITVPSGAVVPNLSTAPQQAQPNWLLIVWICGSVTLLFRLTLGTIRANRLTAETCAAPVTVGWLRPRAILPACSINWLEDKLAIVTAHENEHVRRRDPLIQWLALFNRAIFWFHPLAWWLERRLAALAEEACDEAVLRRGIGANAYADCLFDLAASIGNHTETIASGAMTMPGSKLPARISKILAGPKSGVTRTRLISLTIASAIPCVLFAAGVVSRQPSIKQLILHRPDAPKPPTLIAQARPVEQVASKPPMAFESVTVRGTGWPGQWGGNRLVSVTDGSLSCVCMIDELIHYAYGAQYANIDRVPRVQGATLPWYVIDAKLPRGVTAADGPALVRDLLAQRFHLAAHPETRETPFYDLTLADGSLKTKLLPMPDLNHPQPGYESAILRASSDGATGRVRINGRATLSVFAQMLTGEVNARVRNKTGLDGVIDVSINAIVPVDIFRFAIQNSTTAWLIPPPPDLSLEDRRALSLQMLGDRPDLSGPAPPFDSELAKLGLRLQPTHEPVEYFTIDHVDVDPPGTLPCCE